MKIDIAKLVQDVRDAREVAEKAAVGHSDNGTCNFDSCVLRGVPWTPEVQAAIGQYAFESEWRGKSCIFIKSPVFGQAARRTIAAEAMEHHLRSCGWKATTYYQMD